MAIGQLAVASPALPLSLPWRPQPWEIDLEHLVTNLLSNIMWVVYFSRYQTYLELSSYSLHMGGTTFPSKFYIYYYVVFWHLVLPIILASTYFLLICQNWVFSFLMRMLAGLFLFL